ncbi:unnamed protein product [Camellia sinensis]
MGALTPVFLFLLFLSANSDESSKLDSSCFSAIPIYGIDFNNTPTGRFTNGKTIADFIAILYNLSLPPPYLSLTEAQRKTAMDGINYASAGCGIFPNTKPTGFKHPRTDESKYHLGCLTSVINQNIGPLGCLPSVINKTGNGHCDEQMNIMPYNSQLPQTLKNIQDEYLDATLTLANSHDLLQDILADTKKYGFTDVKDPRCGTYVNGELACIPNSTPCDNRCQYLFFDASHTCEFANCIFVPDMLIKD